MARVLLRDLTPGTKYYVQLRSVTNTDVSEWSQRFPLTTTADTVAPDAPTWTATPIVWKNSSVIISWNTINYTLPQNKDFAHYELEISSAAGSYTIKTKSLGYTLSLQENTTRFGTPQSIVSARVRSVDATGNASAYTALMTASNGAPQPPGSISAMAATDQISITWTASPSDAVVKYVLYVGTSATFTPNAQNKIFEGNALSYTYTTTSYANGLYFKVAAVDALGQISLFTGTTQAVTPVSPFVVDTVAPGAPASANVTTGYDAVKKQAYLDVSWSAVTASDLAQYTIRYGPSSTGPWTYVDSDKDSATTRIYVPAGLTYYVGVRAQDWTANYSAYTSASPSPIVSGADSTPPNQVTGLAVAVNGTSFTATWTPNTDNDLAQYEVGINYSGGTEVLYKTTATRFDFPIELNRSAFGSPKPVVLFRVRAYDFGGNVGAWSTQVTGTNPVPNNPTNLTSSVGPNTITIGWTPPSDTDLIGYNIYQGTAANPTNKVASITGTSFTTSGISSAQYFVVKALDAFNQESSGLSGGPYTPTNPYLVDTTPPAIPSITSASLATSPNGRNSTLTVNWNAVGDSDLAGYVVRYLQSGASTYTELSASKDATSIIAQGLVPYTSYGVQIRSLDYNGNYSNWSATTTAASPSNPVPANVTGLTAKAGKDNIAYSWTAVADLDIKNYELTVSTTSDFSSGNQVITTGQSTSAPVGNLAPGTTYYARVRAIDEAGQPSAAYSSTLTTTTIAYGVNTSDGVAPTSSPTPLVVGQIGYLSVIWPAINNADATTYEVHVSTTSGFTPTTATKYSEVAGTAEAILTLPQSTTKLTYGTTYYVRIVAKDKDGSAPAGTQASGIPLQATANDLSVIIGGGNYSKNSSFENGTTSYFNNTPNGTMAIVTSPVYQGSQSLSYTVTTTSGSLGLGQQITGLTVGTKYLFTSYVYIPSSNGVAGVTLVTYDGSTYASTAINGYPVSTTTTGSWVRLACSVVAGSTSPVFYVLVNGTLTAGTVFYTDAWQVEQGDIPTAWSPNPQEGIDAAASAQTAATNAQTTANGKNKVTYSTSVPGTTSNAVGDIWFVTSGSTVIAQYQGNGGTSWTSVQLTNSVIANLDAGKITSGFIDTNRLNANSITASKLAITIGGGNEVLNSSAETGDISYWALNNAPSLSSSTDQFRFGTRSFKVGTINGTVYPYQGLVARPNATMTLSSFVRASTTGMTVQLYVNQYTDNTKSSIISSTASNPGSLLTTDWTRFSYTIKIASNCTYVEIYPASVGYTATGAFAYFDGVQWEEGDIATGYSPKPDEILPGTISTPMLQARAITTDILAVGAVSAINVAAQAISTDKLTVGAASSSNDMPDGNFTQASPYPTTSATLSNIVPGWTGIAGGGTAQQYRIGLDSTLSSGTHSLGIQATSSSSYGYAASPLIPVVPGERLYWSANIYSDQTVSQGIYYRMSFYAAGNTTDINGAIVSDVQTQVENIGQTGGKYYFYEGIVTVPNGVSYLRTRPHAWQGTEGNGSNATYFSNLVVKRAVTNTVIDNGSITTNKIGANQVTADKVGAGMFTGGIFQVAPGGLMQSSNFVTGVSGWRLNESGLEIVSGVIRASALAINVGGGNIVTYSNFEPAPTSPLYSSLVENYAGSQNIVVASDDKYTGTQSLKTITGATGRGVIIWAGPNDGTQEYLANTKIVGSVYIKATAGNVYNIQYRFRNSGNGYLTEGGNSNGGYTATGGWDRYIMSAFAYTGTTWQPGIEVIQVSGNTSNAMYLDNVQIELGDFVTGYGTKPDEVQPGTIAGNMVKTNSIDAGVLMANTAISQNLNVTSNLTVGNGGNSGVIQSYNYTSGSAGWQILYNGNAEFNSVTVRGNIQGNSNSSFTGGVFTGGTFQTGTSNAGVLRINGNGLVAYNVNGTQTFGINQVGDALIGGNTTVAGTTILSGTLTVNGGISITGTAGNAYLRGGGFTGGTSSGASGTGYILDVNGLYVGAGSVIQAQALQLQSGAANLLPAHQSSYELPATWYTNLGVSGGNVNSYSVGISTAQAYAGTQSMALTYNMSANGTIEYIDNNYPYPVSVITGKTYIISYYYYYTGSNSSTYTIPVVVDPTGTYTYPNGTISNNNFTSVSNKWQRVSFTHTVTANTTSMGIHPRIVNSAAESATIYFDAIMIEEQQSAKTTPSTYVSGGFTTIDGNMIRTGSIQSNVTTTVNGSTVPLWSINTNGYASFAGAQILGNTVLGLTSAGDTSQIASANYSQGSKGWRISNTDGNTEFNNIAMRGTLTGGPGSSITSGNIYGTNLYGSMFSTAAQGGTGQRIVMYDDGNGGALFSYAGISGESPGKINPGLNSGNVPKISITSGTYSSNNENSIITLVSGTSGTSQFNVGASLIRLNGSTNIAAGSVLSVDTIGTITGSGDLTLKGGASGVVKVSGGSNILGMIRSQGDGGGAFTFVSNGNLAATVATNNNATLGAGNTVNFYANTLRSFSGVFDTTYTSGTASFNANGRIVQTTSSQRFKHDIQPMSMDMAQRTRLLEPVTFVYNEDQYKGSDRWPGFIAEQAEKIGLEEFLYRDDKGQVSSFKYSELVSAHVMLINDLYEKNETLETEVEQLTSRLEKLEKMLEKLVS